MYVLEGVSNLDTASVHIALAFVFIACGVTTLTSTMLPKFRNGKKKRYGSHMSDGSGSYSSHLRPDEILGNILTKYNTITKEAQIEMCIKHIEVWKVFMAETELRDGVDNLAATKAVKPVLNIEPQYSAFSNKAISPGGALISPTNKGASLPFRLVTPSRGHAASSAALN